MAKGKGSDGDGVTIKKYANRRLYNTGTSSYITLDDLARMVREGVEFSVLDAKTGDDITHSILTQIIVEQEASGQQMLPVGFLRQLIGMYGGGMQDMIPSYLEASMTNFCANQAKMREAFETSLTANPFAKMAEANLAMMRSATGAFAPKDDASKPGDLTALREQMDAMQKKLDELSR